MSGGKAKKIDTSNIYYVTKAELDAARERAAIRLARKAEFQKLATDPQLGNIDADPIVSA